MAQRGGELAAKSSKPSGEDRLSALPDDVLVLILLRLGTREAIRTSGLSRRWRRVWALLPELRFDDLVPDGVGIRRILEAPEEAAPLRWISVTTQGAGPESAAAWLPVAARRVSGELVYHNMPPATAMNEHGDVDKDDDKPVGGGDLHLPCFEKATTISLNINFLGLALPPQGIFARLTELSLRRLRFRSPYELGSVVSSPRCPCLKKLEVCNSRGLQNLSIHSESLLQLKLLDLHRLLHLTIVAPILQELGVGSCIRARGPSEPVAIANISAPQLVALDWKDFYDPQYVHLGDLGQLQRLTTAYDAYGRHTTLSQHRLRLLQRFQAAALYSLHLWLIYLQDIDDLQYLVGDIKMLPQITSLHLVVVNGGHAHHAFGASSFHLLRMCTGLRSLYLFVARSNLELEVQSTCPSGCICDQPMNWKIEELVLNHLDFVMIVGLHGADHEVAFLKQLFNWATVLRRMIIVFDYRISESKAREFRRAVVGSSRPETSVEFHICHDASKRTTCLLAPEGHGTML